MANRTDKLEGYTKKVLASMAKESGIAGWHAMRKDELVKALSKAAATRKAKRSTSPATTAEARSVAQRKRTGISKTIEAHVGNNNSSKYHAELPSKDLSRRAPTDLPNGYGKDRIVVMVRDPFWLHAYWEITRGAVVRAEAALGQDWHTSKPILRVLDVTSDDTTSASEAHVRDIEIHGGVNNWYVDVPNPPRAYRIDIGYLTRHGRFFVVARSNTVNTPAAGVSDVIDENWTDVAEQYEKIYAMSGGYDPSSSMELKQLFEERLRRPMGSPAVTSFGSGAMGARKERSFWFKVDAELIVYGATEPGAHVTLQGEPVSLRPDGTFTMRFSMPDSRQIIPAVAASADGVEEHTIVLAVERNTKELEPLIHDGSA
jgi:hypothetical protein